MHRWNTIVKGKRGENMNCNSELQENAVDPDNPNVKCWARVLSVRL
jgi:hypothetical protein